MFTFSSQAHDDMANLINHHHVSADDVATLRHKLFTTGTQEVIPLPTTTGSTVKVCASVSGNTIHEVRVLR
jgi:hypothetical protein